MPVVSRLPRVRVTSIVASYSAERTSWGRALLLAIGIIAIVLAWLFSTPPGGAPDELDHYNRALSAGQGQWLGAPVHDLRGRFLNLGEATSYLLTTRRVDVPARLLPPSTWGCLLGNHVSSAACIARPSGPGPASQLTGEGTRLPFLYAPAGAMGDLLAGDPQAALTVGRLMFALLSLALLVTATWLCWDGHGTSLIGLALAISPGVLWAAAMLNPSGPEIAAGVLMAAAAVRLGRDPGAVGRGWWISVAFGSLVLALARPPGPGWLALYLLLFLAEARPAGVRAAVARTPRWAVAAAIFAVTGVVANIAWQTHVPPQGLAPTIGAAIQSAGPASLSVPETIGEEIGVFGADDVLMPRWAYAVWGAAFIAIIAVALLRGRRRDLRLVEVALLGSFAIRWAFDLLLDVTAGSPAQGRHLLPITVAVVILAGEAIHRNRKRLPRLGALLAAVAVAAASIQVVGWISAAHRFAVGSDGPWWFFPVSQWSPPGGWLPSLVLVLAGGGLMLLALLPGRHSGTSRASPDLS